MSARANRGGPVLRGGATAFAAFVVASGVGAAEGQELSLRQRQAARIVAAADRLTAEIGEEIWPGFTFAEIPVAIFEPGGEAILFHAREVPAGYRDVSLPDPPLEFHAGPTTPAMNANTSGILAGKITAFVELDSLAPGPSLAASQLVLLVHECGHAFQSRAPDGGAERWPREQAMHVASYPADLAENNAWGQLEGRCLCDALRTSDSTERRERIRDFLVVRDFRRRLLPPELVTFENHAELNEGLAEYFGRRALELADEVPVDGLDAAECGRSGRNFADLLQRVGEVNVLGKGATRDRFYWTGSAQAFLLDAVHPGWKAEVEGAGRTLGELLREKAELDADGADARREVVADRYGFARRLERERDLADALAEQRERRLAAAWGSEGRKLVLDLGAVGGAQVQSFDPLNLEVLAPGMHLHSRFVEFSFRGGRAHFETAALEDQGDAQVVCTLPSDLEREHEARGLVLRAEGVELHFDAEPAILEDPELVLVAPGREELDLELEPYFERIDQARQLLALPATAPRWSATDLTGRLLRSESDPPRRTAIFFFSAAPWATPAHRAFRDLQEALGDLPRDTEALRVILVATQCTSEELATLLGARGREDQLVHDSDRFLQRAFGVSRLPAYLEVDTEGRIVGRWTGGEGNPVADWKARLGR